MQQSIKSIGRSEWELCDLNDFNSEMTKRKYGILSLLFLLVIASVNAQIRDLKKLEKLSENRFSPGKELFDAFESQSEPFNLMTADEQTIENVLSNSNATVQCIRDIIYYVKNLVMKRSDWALQSKIN